MSTIQRFEEKGFPYFVTTVVKHRQSIFTSQLAAASLRDVLDRCRHRYRFLVLSYVIMPDHLHAVIVPGPSDTISSVMRYTKGTFAREYNAQRRIEGAVWQPRFYDTVVRNIRSLNSRIRYIEENPVQAGLVTQPNDYEFSSANPSWHSDLDDYLDGALETRAHYRA